eukprot:6469266-Pyramimonas_sp.AAC.1
MSLEASSWAQPERASGPEARAIRGGAVRARGWHGESKAGSVLGSPFERFQIRLFDIGRKGGM